jgi:two-component system, NtrC family, sensor kinase
MATVLIIDALTETLSQIKAPLEADGHDVLYAVDARSALESFEQESPEVVFLDVRIPDLLCCDLLGMLKEINPDSEVLVLGTNDDLDLILECLKREACHFINKPINPELIRLCVQRALEKLALKQKIKQYTRNLETLVREANVELERAYNFRENIIENSPDSIVCIKKGGEIVIFNSAAEKLLGYKKNNVIGKMNIVQLYLPGVAKQIMKDIRSKEFGGTGILQKREVNLLDKDSQPIPVYISASLLYEDGLEAGSVGIFTDLREKKKLEKQLLRSEKLSSLGKLSAGIAHEINQPLTGVLTFAHLLLRKFKNEEVTRKDLELIVRETSRIKGIVQGILDFAREAPMEKKPHRIDDILEKTLGIVVRQERFFGINVVRNYDPTIPEIVFDGNLMEQVFMNIILNAADAMRGAGTLTVTTRTANGWAEVDFEDTGVGMPESILDKIFEPFFTTKHSSEGTGMGLGLSVSYGIVKSHNGEMFVTSKEGVGSKFTVRLPFNGD